MNLLYLQVDNFLQKKELIINKYNNLAKLYNSRYDDKIHQHEDLFLQFELDATDTIDIGCGTGLGIKLMGEGPSNYLGIDISPSMLDIARKIYPDRKFTDKIDITTKKDFSEFKNFNQLIALYGVPNYVGLENLFYYYTKYKMQYAVFILYNLNYCPSYWYGEPNILNYYDSSQIKNLITKYKIQEYFLDGFSYEKSQRCVNYSDFNNCENICRRKYKLTKCKYLILTLGSIPDDI